MGSSHSHSPLLGDEETEARREQWGLARSPCPAVLTLLGGQCRCLQLGAGRLPRPRAHIEGDSSGITNLGRFKESENILALAGCGRGAGFPSGIPASSSHTSGPRGGKGLGGREARVGMHRKAGTGPDPEWGSWGREKANRHPDGRAHGRPFPPHLHSLQSRRGEATAQTASQARRARGSSGSEP